MKKALITGISGQDGAYLAEFLLEKGYHVHGIKRRSLLINANRIDHLHQDPFSSNHWNFILYHGDMTDASSFTHILQRIQPDEVHNLAAQGHVAVSFEEPEYAADSDELVRIIARVIGYEGVFVSDRTKPDGTPQKLLDISEITGLGWRPRTSLEKEIRSADAWYCANVFKE